MWMFSSNVLEERFVTSRSACTLVDLKKDSMELSAGVNAELNTKLNTGLIMELTFLNK